MEEISLETLEDMLIYQEVQKRLWKEEDCQNFASKQAICIKHIEQFKGREEFEEISLDKIQMDIKNLSEDKSYILEATNRMYMLFLELTFKIAMLQYQLQEEAD